MRLKESFIFYICMLCNRFYEAAIKVLLDRVEELQEIPVIQNLSI